MDFKILLTILLLTFTVICVAKPHGRSSGRCRGRSHTRRGHRQSCNRRTYYKRSCHHENNHNGHDDCHNDHDDHHDDHDNHNDYNYYDNYDDGSARGRNINQSQRGSTANNRKRARVEVSARRRSNSNNIQPNNQRPYIENPGNQREDSPRIVSARIRRPPTDDNPSSRQRRPIINNKPKRRRPNVGDTNSRRPVQPPISNSPNTNLKPTRSPPNTEDESNQPLTPNPPSNIESPPWQTPDDDNDPDEDLIFLTVQLPNFPLDDDFIDDDYDDKDYRF